MWIDAQHYNVTANIPPQSFSDNLVFYISENIVNCWSYRKYDIAFKNEEDLMRFMLSFDEEDFYKVYETIEPLRKKKALAAILKQANELDW